ncbi:MAG: hypothetical protein M3032_13350 [Verrucomicrobiota bacterium]|nr:hypothetical protein [Verrucomicrobiota bacterium]
MWREANGPMIASATHVTPLGNTRLSNENGESSTEPKALRLTPGRNQKGRSKLNQVPDTSGNAAPTPAPPSPPPPAPPAPPPDTQPSLRRTRFKRSGQMREDLLLPDEGAPQKSEDEY